MFLFSPFEIYSQTFPVQVSVQLTPPYSLNLADYSSPESERLAFTILLADINRPELQVRFRLRIEGQGIEIQTSPGYNPPPYVLQGGIPERITGFDLAPYFNPANLEFRGVTRAHYLQTSKLPEGLYRLCIEVVEYNRNVVVSNTGCANAWLVLNDPPLVNVPANADKIRILNPQNIIFQWTPRHTGSPNAAFRTEYECTLVELWPATRNPNDAILSSPPILKETTSSTTFIYGPSETPLVAGRHYAFRVQAKSISGISQLDLFKNNGYSQVITFQYGDPCLAPEPVTATALDPERIKLEWTASAQHTEYAVEYRQAGSTQWYDQETYLPYTTLTNLRAGTSYEYQVKAVCGPVESEPGELKSATTKDLIPSSLVCGTSLPIFSLDNTQLLDQLNPGDVVKAGDFDVTIRKATGTGSFTGSGTVEVAFFKNAKVNVEFESIKVNPEYRLVEGKMEVKGVGVDVLGDNVTDLLDQLDDALITADDILKDVAADLDLANEILDEVGKLANDIADNGPFTTDQEAKLDGVTSDKYLEEAEKAMKSAASALASAGSVGNTAEAARSVAQALTLRNRANKLKKIYAEADTLKVIAVEFVGTDNYGFDIQGYPQHRLHYNIMVTPDNVSTSVPWVSTKEGEASNVVARLLPSANIPAENIIFKAGESTLVANQNGNDWTVALPAAKTGTTLTVRAIDKTTGDTVGKLDVVTYSPIARKLNIVPVGTTTTLTAADVEAELDRIYKQAVADWDVAILPALSVPGYTGTLQDDKQALLSVYSDGMKEIIRTFEASGTYSKDEFYLFLVDNSQTGKAGYMPRKHRYGFIYQNANTDPIRTISHELGHGAFRLQHIAEEYPTIGKITENLMDSTGTGPLLRKYQWDQIHNPPIVIGLLEDEGEGALEVNINLMKVIESVREINKKNEIKIFDLSQFFKQKIEFRKSRIYSEAILQIENQKIPIGAWIYIFSDPDLNKVESNIYSVVDYSTKLSVWNNIAYPSKKIIFNNSQPDKIKEQGYIGNDITALEFIVKDKDHERFLLYLLGKDLLFPSFEYEPTVVNQVASSCSQWSSNNNVGYTCNFCVRDAFYKITGSAILYPAASNNICVCCSPQENNVKGGLVVGDGTANTIYSTLSDSNSNLSKQFEEIKDITGEMFPDFIEMQNDANNGQMIIGVKSANTGHIVLLMPENLWEEESTDKERNLLLANQVDETSRPIALECGTADNKRVQPVRWSTEDLKAVKWYKYKGL